MLRNVYSSFLLRFIPGWSLRILSNLSRVKWSLVFIRSLASYKSYKSKALIPRIWCFCFPFVFCLLVAWLFLSSSRVSSTFSIRKSCDKSRAYFGKSTEARLEYERILCLLPSTTTELYIVVLLCRRIIVIIL